MTVRPYCGLTDCELSIKWIKYDFMTVPHCWSAIKGQPSQISACFATTNLGYTVYNVLINFWCTGRHFGYFGVF